MSGGPGLCEGCEGCALAEPWFDEKRGEVGGGCAPPSGSVAAKLLVVGEAPGRDEVRKGQPFVGASGRMLRSAIQQFGVDPETEVRYVNVVQCRPPYNEDPEPDVRHRCTVLADELASFRGRAVLAVGRTAAERLLGAPYLRKLGKARSTWDGYVHDAAVSGGRVDLGHALVHEGAVYKSGKRKGEPKATKRLLSAEVPMPPSVVGIVASLHPSAVMRTGFSNVVQFKAAVQRACALAQGAEVLSHEALAGLDEAVERPTDWDIPEDGTSLDLVFDIENTEQGLTDISFVEVAKDGTLGQRGSFGWGPATRALTERLLGAVSPYRVLVAHNAAYDCGQLGALAGIAVRGSGLGERGEGLACSMMAAQLDQPDLPKALGAMWRYLGPMPPWKHLSGDNMRLYNLLDSVVTAMAWAVLRRRLAENGQRTLMQTEMASIMVLDRMTRNGLPVDADRMLEWVERTEARIEVLREEWTRLTGLDVLSGKRVNAWFFEEHGCPVLATTPSGQPKLDGEVMEKLREGTADAEVKTAIDLLLELKDLTKQASTYGRGYLAKLDDQGYLHPSYLPDVKDSGDLGTAAGRLSSSPNVQNVPKDLRWIFKAPEGWVIGDSDLRAVEGRVQAVLAEDHELLEMYDRPDFDMHTWNLENAHAALVKMWKADLVSSNQAAKTRARFVLERYEAANADGLVWPVARKNMKTFLYGWNYGAGDKKIAASLGIPLREAKCIREAYEASRPATAKWRKAVVREAASRRRLQNAFGRIRYFPGVVPDANVRNQAINFFPQSTVADMFWTWFPQVEEALARFGGHLITQVHDSFVWMAPAENAGAVVAALDEIMTQEWPQIAPGFSVPSTHEVGPSWGEVEPWEAA